MDCATYQSLPPVYLEVRRSQLLHVGIGDPNDPYNYNEIAPYLVGYIDDVNPPFGTVIPQLEIVPVTVYPCGDPATGIPGVQAGAELDELRVICSGNFGPLIAGKPGTKGNGYVFAGKSVFFGLDQVVTYVKHGDTPPPFENFDVDFELENGNPPQDYSGFTFIDFAPDNPTVPNGNGSYFFVLQPKAKIVMHTIH